MLRLAGVSKVGALQVSETTHNEPSSFEEIGPRPHVWRVLLLVALSFLMLTGIPYLKSIPPIFAIVGASLVFLLLSILLMREYARFRANPLVDVLLLLIFLAGWYLVAGLAEGATAARPALSGVSSILFLLACVCFGRLVSLIIREKNIVLPVALMAGLADVFTVFLGPTAKALEEAPEFVTKLSVGIPAAGSAAGPEGGAALAFIATAGLGDFIFITLFLMCVYRFGMRDRATVGFIFLFTALGMMLVFFSPLPALPLLPFVVAGFLIANRGVFDLTRNERIYMVVATAFIIGLMIVAWSLLRG